MNISKDIPVPFTPGNEIESNHEEEMIKLTKELHKYFINALCELRKSYPKRIPKELLAQEVFFKEQISCTAVYLAETNNWYM